MQNFKTLVVLLVVVASVVARPSTVEEGQRLIKTSEDKPGTWMNEEEILTLVRQKVTFMDITDRKYPLVPHASITPRAFPPALRFNSAVTGAIAKLDVNRLEAFLSVFDDFRNRYYNSALGAEASDWLLAQVTETINNSGYQGNATARAFSHSWQQNSVIARIEGSESGVVILGCHMDSINGNNPIHGLAPGADDNGSGSTALLEALRVLLESGFVPKKSIEFQWYAAEEIGLRGSQDIAENYLENNVDVIAMMNYDVVGYRPSGSTKVSFLTDYTDASLNAFLRLVVDGYLTFTSTNSVCGYGCSDHASFTSVGFPAASPSEDVLSPYMHTVNDVIATVNFPQVLEFTKLAVGYAIELGEPRD